MNTNWEAAYHRHTDALYRYLLLRTGDTARAEDVLSQTWMKAIEQQEKFTDDGRGLAPWLFRIARNTLIDTTRKHKNHADINAAEPITSNTDAVHDAHQRLLYERIMHLLEDFHDTEREIILLKICSGQTFREIAEMLNLNESTIKTKYFRTLKSLQTKATKLQLLALILLLSS